MSLGSQQQIQVLHVDDDPSITDLTGTFLERGDDRFTVETATSANEGLERINDRPPDCIISDYNMPGMDGIEFLQTVREEHPDLPFILFTGKGSEAVASDAIAADVTDYLQKGGGTSHYTVLANRISNAVEATRSAAKAEERRHRLEQILKTVPGCVAQLDADGQFVFANERTEEVLGLETDELTQRAYNDPEWELQDLNGEPISDEELPFRQARDTGEPVYDAEHTVTWPDGSHKILSVNAAPLFDETGDVESVVVSLNDITEQRERQRELGLLQRAIEDAADGVAIIDDEEYVYVDRSHIDMYGLEDKDQLLGSTWRELYDDDGIERLEREAFPALEADGHWRGMVTGSRPDGSTFPAALSLTVVEDGRIICTVRDETERRDRERELESERRFIEQTLDVLDELFYVIDTDGTLRRWNAKGPAVTGYSESELDGMSAIELFPEGERETVSRSIETTLTDGEATVSADLLTADGQRIPYEFSGARLTDGDGNTTGLVGIGRDLTERRQRERRFRALVEESNDIISIVDSDGRYQYQSPSVERILGYAPEDTVGDKAWEYIHPDDRERILEEFRTWVHHPNRVSEAIEYRAQHADGSWRWMEAEGNGQFSNPAVEGYVINSRDITDRRERQRELGLLRQAIDDANVPITLADPSQPDEALVYVNDAFEEMTGYPPEETLGRNCRFLQGENTDPGKTIALREAIDNEEQVSVELCNYRKDGTEFWNRLTVTPIYDDDGRFVRYLGIQEDVTERKELERELAQTRDLMSNTQQSTDTGAWEYDPANERLMITDGTRRLYGLSPDADLTLEAALDAVHRDDRDQLADRLTNCLETGEPYETDVRLTTASGEQRWITVRGERVTEQESGDIVRGYIQDITEQKRDKEQLKRRDEQLSRLHEATRNLFDADSLKQVAQTASQAADDVLGLPVNGIHFYDDTAGGLVPVAVSEASRELFEQVPTIDDGIALETFQRGDFQIYADVREAPNVYDPETPIRSEMFLPLGDYGVLIISSQQVESFDDASVKLARTLAANTETALERTDREQELRAREEHLVQNNERLKEFAGIVSHDLRNPLQVADGRVELIREECESDHVTHVAQALDRMRALIDDLLTLAREGEDVSEVEPIELAGVAEKSWQTTETAHATLEADLPQVIQADKSRVQQLFGNLYRNAVEHGGDDVRVSVGAMDDGFYLSDSGPGVPESDREEIFEAGYSTNDEGTGFGLRIVEQIVDAHGWDITVTDSKRGGTRFEVTGVEVADR